MTTKRVREKTDDDDNENDDHHLMMTAMMDDDDHDDDDGNGDVKLTLVWCGVSGLGAVPRMHVGALEDPTPQAFLAWSFQQNMLNLKLQPNT